MIIRKIKPEELKRVKELSAISFEYGEDTAKSAEEIFRETQNDPRSRADLHWQCRWAAFDDDGQMMSTMAAIPFRVQFDGHHCPMTGIGGVVTLPPYRRRGGIRACFEAALPAMYAEGAAFSYLYPFSTAYYRKFGYELCCERNEYKLLLEQIPHTDTGGTLYLVEPGRFMLEDIKAVYRAWQETYNMMVVAEDFEFRWVAKSNPVQDQQYTYVYKSRDGVPKAYATFRVAEENGEHNLQCSRFFHTDAEGFCGLMNLFASLAADHCLVSFALPQNEHIEPLLPEWCLGARPRETSCYGMVRAVNVEAALRMARARGEGTVTLEITDEQIPQNNGRFQVRYRDNAVTGVEKTAREADASLGIQDFSRLITGVYDIDALRFLKGVAVHTDPGRLAGLFFRKPIYISEYF